ncbi:smoothelin [Boleophthalmus pectinirostris]|uniref:smoothelin n=1 Tax=Boleophthalmus pectinirostris TaxID=150288 RepID=UPI00242FCBC1|nr:smoothelin [Boleophthalmus pectinirostris]
MVLVFDPLLKDEGPQPLLIQAPREAPREALNPGPDLVPPPRQRSDSASSDRSSSSVHSGSNLDSAGSSYRGRLGSGASDKSQGPLQRSRLDSGASDKSQEPLQRSRLDSGASDKSQGPIPRGRLDSGASDKSQGPLQRNRLDSGASDKSQGPLQRNRLDSGASDKSQGPLQRNRLDSGASDKSQGTLQRSRLDSGASEHSVGSVSRTRTRMDSDPSDPGPRPRLGSAASEHSASVCSDEKGPSEEPTPVTNGSTHCTDSEGESAGPAVRASAPHDQPDGAGLSRQGPKTGLTNGGLKGRSDFLNQKIISSSLSNGKPKDAVLEHFSRTNSVRDRLRKYTESTQSTQSAQSAPYRSSPAPRINPPTDRTPRREANPPAEPVSSLGQSESSGGGAGPAGEKHGAEEEQAPGSRADADMKTFLTIEIKDGRAGGSQGPRNNPGPLSSMGALGSVTPRINTSALGQRTGLPGSPWKLTVMSRLQDKIISSSLSNGKPKDAVLEHFSRTNSVRDRLRKYTESTQSTQSAQSAPYRSSPAPRINPPTDRTPRREANPPAEPVSSLGQSESSGGGAGPAGEKHGAEEEQAPGSRADADMKTFLTIEIKDGRAGGSQGPRNNPGPLSSMGALGSVTPRINTSALGQRTELTLGLRATPFKISSSTFSSAPSIKMETEPIVASEPVFSAPPSVQVGRPAADLPNGSSAPPPVTATPAAKAEERPAKVTPETLAAIEDEELLDKMLDESKDFEERRLIRAAMRDLRKRKRDQREKERESRLQELRQQRDQKTASRGGAGTGAGAGTGEVVIRKLEKSADGNTLSQVTKTERFAQSDDGSRSSRSTVVETSYVQKTDRGTVQSKSYSYSSSSSSSTSMSSNTKKVGSVFDREDDSLSRGGGLAAMERRQAERRKELMRAQTMPKASSMQARKAMIERLDKDATPGSGGPGVVKINRVQRSTSFGVPNANSIKQMLLDWCRAKTRSYEHVNIQNFSSSWSNGMAFCALVHHFFPEAFDYSSLNPSERRHNFDLAFSTAEKMVDCPQLLDVDDMVKMREPDWKCVYTYLQEFYRGLVTKGLVKTRGNS